MSLDNIAKQIGTLTTEQTLDTHNRELTEDMPRPTHPDDVDIDPDTRSSERFAERDRQTHTDYDTL